MINKHGPSGVSTNNSEAMSVSDIVAAARKHAQVSPESRKELINELTSGLAHDDGGEVDQQAIGLIDTATGEVFDNQDTLVQYLDSMGVDLKAARVPTQEGLAFDDRQIHTERSSVGRRTLIDSGAQWSIFQVDRDQLSKGNALLFDETFVYFPKGRFKLTGALKADGGDIIGMGVARGFSPGDGVSVSLPLALAAEDNQKDVLGTFNAVWGDVERTIDTGVTVDIKHGTIAKHGEIKMRAWLQDRLWYLDLIPDGSGMPPQTAANTQSVDSLRGNVCADAISSAMRGGLLGDPSASPGEQGVIDRKIDDDLAALASLLHNSIGSSSSVSGDQAGAHHRFPCETRGAPRTGSSSPTQEPRVPPPVSHDRSSSNAYRGTKRVKGGTGAGAGAGAGAAVECRIHRRREQESRARYRNAAHPCNGEYDRQWGTERIHPGRLLQREICVSPPHASRE